MKLIFNDERIECAKAIKGTDYIKLYNSDNIEIASFGGILDFSGYVLNEGEWDTPEPTDTEKLTAKIEYIAMMGGYDELL